MSNTMGIMINRSKRAEIREVLCKEKRPAIKLQTAVLRGNLGSKTQTIKFVHYLLI